MAQKEIIKGLRKEAFDPVATPPTADMKAVNTILVIQAFFLFPFNQNFFFIFDNKRSKEPFKSLFIIMLKIIVVF